MKRYLPPIFESESKLIEMMNQEKRKRYCERLQALYLLKSGQAEP
tara:strand:+ start:7616 stop:7750 length:135 start_codon:yes stop_codon:yes gene_type:complete